MKINITIEIKQFAKSGKAFYHRDYKKEELLKNINNHSTILKDIDKYCNSCKKDL